MSYLVLARKWRPESFSDVVGQKHVVLTLEAAIRTGRTAHAYLFSGPRGVGKTTIARILAKALNCEKGPTEEPCGTCSSCTEIASGKSLDVIEIDGASNRKIEDARGIRETVQYAPLSGRMKVYIIDEAHMLTREAFNALLKTLEEPPPHVVFVLATTEPGKIPETITSRCQTFDFHRIASSDIEARLAKIASAEGFDIEPSAIKVVAARADGSMRDASSLLDQLVSVGKSGVSVDDVARVLGIPDVDVFFSLTDAIAGHDTAATLTALEDAIAAGFDPRDLVDGLVEHLRNLLLVSAVPDPERLVGRAADYRAHEGASSTLAEEDLVRLLRMGIEAQAAVKWSTQPGLIVELALVRMSKLASTVELADLVRALNAAPGGGTGGPGAGSEGSGGPGRRRKSAPASSYQAARGGAAGGGAATGVSETPSPPAPERATVRVEKTDERPPASVEPAQWPDVLEKIRSQKPALAAFLTDAVPASSEVGLLELSVPNGSGFHRDQLRDRGNMKMMERAAGDVYGGRVHLTLTFGEPQRERETGEATRAQSAPEPAPEQDEPAGDDVVRRVLDMFGGTVRSSGREE